MSAPLHTQNVLVHSDGSPRCAARLKAAVDLAERLGARLTPMFAATPPALDLAYAYAAESLPVDLLQDVYLEWREQAFAQFEAAGVARESCAELAPVTLLPGFTAQARFADLLVLGQHDPADRERRVPADFVPSVLVESGRPGVVLPYAGPIDSIGRRHALVAWKQSASSTRALVASLPMLRQAERVTVIEWGAEPSDSRGAALDIGGYLALHGVRAKLEQQSAAPEDVGELLLSRAADFGADLLVMGCYGHSRTREFVLGGATRTVLRSMTLPVLMCH